VLYSESAWQIQTVTFNPGDYVRFPATYTGGDNCSVAFYREDVYVAGYGPLNPSGGSHYTQSSTYGTNDGQVGFRWEYVCGLGSKSQTCDSIIRAVDVQHSIATLGIPTPTAVYDSWGKFAYLRFDGPVTGHCAPGNLGTVGFRIARRVDDGDWIGIPAESSPPTRSTECGGSTYIAFGDTLGLVSTAPGPHTISFRVWPIQSVPRYPFSTDEVTASFDLCDYLDNDGDGVSGCVDCDNDNPLITVEKDSPECPCERVGQPIAPVNGQMSHTLPLFTDPSAVPLSLQYDSAQEVDRGMGVGWRTSWDSPFVAGLSTVYMQSLAGDSLKFTADGMGG
jgi:hypothetical protein